MNKKWFLGFLPLAFVLVGCQEAYRYPCQDPENWGEKMCQKPYCSANGTCPEDLTHYEKNNLSPQQGPAAPMNKGVCK